MDSALPSRLPEFCFSPARSPIFPDSAMETAQSPDSPAGAAASMDSVGSTFSDIMSSMQLDSSEASQIMEQDSSLVDEKLDSVDRPAGVPQQASHRPAAGGVPLPKPHEFRVVVNFLNYEMIEETVQEQSGCLLYYESPDQPMTAETAAATAHLRKIPITTFIKTEKGERQEFPWRKGDHKKYTEMVLRSFDKGMSLYARDGNLYAMRHCNTKLFWSSTQRDDKQAVELVREQETEIFNGEKFETIFREAIRTEQQATVRVPAVRFSFAQLWDIHSCPLTTKIVSARVEPMMAGKMVEWMNISNPNFKSTAHYDGYHTSLFQFSNISSQAAE